MNLESPDPSTDTPDLPGPMAVLLQTGRVAAEATVERLHAADIEARILDLPNAFVRLMSGGNYRVRVSVPEAELERARIELERWASEARPRVRALAREVQRVLLAATLAALALGASLMALGAQRFLWCAALLWLAILFHWVLRSRRSLPETAQEP